jgi:hypothetical protein
MDLSKTIFGKNNGSFILSSLFGVKIWICEGFLYYFAADKI